VRPAVIAVGDLDPERVSEQLAGAFGRREDTVTAAQLPVVTWVGGNGGDGSRIVTRDKAQAALAMAFPGPSRSDGDRAAAEVWAAVASGLGGRLFEALRDRQSLAYTVMASAWGKARGGALLSYIATSPEREAEARQEMLKELSRFTLERVSEAELQQAINYLSGQAEVSRQSGSAVAAEILEAWIAGTGLQEMEDPAARFRRVTADDVLRVASRYLDSARRVEGVVRGTLKH
jgi:zinc protease